MSSGPSPRAAKRRRARNYWFLSDTSPLKPVRRTSREVNVWNSNVVTCLGGHVSLRAPPHLAFPFLCILMFLCFCFATKPSCFPALTQRAPSPPKFAQPRLSRSNDVHPQREGTTPARGTNLGVFVPLWLVLPRCEGTNLGVLDLCHFALLKRDCATSGGFGALNLRSLFAWEVSCLFSVAVFVG